MKLPLLQSMLTIVVILALVPGAAPSTCAQTSPTVDSFVNGDSEIGDSWRRTNRGWERLLPETPPTDLTQLHPLTVASFQLLVAILALLLGDVSRRANSAAKIVRFSKRHPATTRNNTRDRQTHAGNTAIRPFATRDATAGSTTALMNDETATFGTTSSFSSDADNN